MTLARPVPHRSIHADTPTLRLPQSARADPAPLLDAAIAAGVHPGAFRFLYVAARNLPHHEWLVLDRFAEAAGVQHHASRLFAKELVDAGLLRRKRTVVVVGGKKRDRYLYLLAVPR